MINFSYISIDIFHLVPEMAHRKDVQKQKNYDYKWRFYLSYYYIEVLH